jgi:hypothetical protein
MMMMMVIVTLMSWIFDSMRSNSVHCKEQCQATPEND